MPDEKPSYTDRTERLKAWGQMVKSLTPFIWLVVILIVLIPLIGRFFIASSISQDITAKNRPQTVVISPTPLQRQNIDQSLINAVETAEEQARNYASEELNQWVDELQQRVDTSFLPWYFDYFTQKQIEFTTPIKWLSSAVTYWINSDNPPPQQVVAEKLTRDFQTEFAKRVLRPQVEQLKLERMTKETTQIYIDELKNNLSLIQSSYNIPQGQWERYLDDIAVTVSDTEGNLSNLSMKVLVGGSTYLLAKTLLPATLKMGSKIAASVASKGSAKLAAKTGGAVASQLGILQFLDPIVGVGIIIWDVWDYHHTVQIEKPVLREAIADYLEEIKASLLDDSIMSAIHQVENNLAEQFS